MSSASVPITGMGVLAPGAIGLEAFAAFLREGRSAAVPIDRFDTTGLRARKAALLQGFNPKDFINPMKMRRMNALSRYALAAAKLALRDAGVEKPDEPTGVAVGTAFGPVQTSVDYMQEYVEKGPALASPQLFAESVANAPGSHVAIEFGLRGFNVTVTQRESSALTAAMYACSQILKGSVRSALVGGVEEANEMLFSVLDRLGALAPAPDEEARPFDRRRKGMLLGEGSAFLLAGGEGKVQGHLSGFGMARDTTAPISDWGTDAEAVARAMRIAIDDAGLSVSDIDAVYASANGSLRGDSLEARAISALFGASPPPVVALKGLFGEYAAAGALQLVAAVVAVRDQMLHGSPGFELPDEEVRFEVTRSSRPAPLRHILVNSLSAGGGVVAAIVSRESR